SRALCRGLVCPHSGRVWLVSPTGVNWVTPLLIGEDLCWRYARRTARREQTSKESNCRDRACCRGQYRRAISRHMEQNGLHGAACCPSAEQAENCASRQQ